MRAMTLLEILLAVAALGAVAPFYLRGVRATAIGSLESCRFALAGDEPTDSA